MGIQTAAHSLNNDNSPIGFRNRIINGDWSVNQREITNQQNVTGNTSTYLYRTADVWRHGADTYGATVGTTTRVVETYNNLSWGKYVTNVTYDGSSFTSRPFVYVVEDKDLMDLIGKKVTFSFLWRASTNGQYSVAVGYANDSQFSIFSWNYTGNGEAQKFSFTFTVPTDILSNRSGSSVWGMSFYFNYGVANGDARLSNDTNLNGTFNAYGGQAMLTRTTDYKYWQVVNSWIAITQFQLEAGTVATAFEKRPYVLEKYLCSRYLYVWKSPYDTNHYLPAFVYDTNTVLISHITIPAQLRTGPSITNKLGNIPISYRRYDGTAGASSVVPTAISVSARNNTYLFELQYTYSSAWGTATTTGSMSYGNASTPHVVEFSAEI